MAPRLPNVPPVLSSSTQHWVTSTAASPSIVGPLSSIVASSRSCSRHQQMVRSISPVGTLSRSPQSLDSPVNP